jgi:hypothetical protein
MELKRAACWAAMWAASKERSSVGGMGFWTVDWTAESKVALKVAQTAVMTDCEMAAL